jgi:uncharacterized phage protein (TIGR02218 family)
MKPLSPTLLSHLAGGVTTLALCVRVVRRDRARLGFTSFDKDIVMDGLTYRADSGLRPSAAESTADLRVDTIDLAGVLRSSALTESDLLGGLYDGAAVDIFLINHQTPPSVPDTTNAVWLRSGSIGEVRQTGSAFIAEIRGLSESLNRAPFALYSPTCRVKRLGGNRCNASLSAHTFTYTVASIIDARRFTHSAAPKADGFFQYGTVTFSGGVEGVVKSYTTGVIELIDPLVVSLGTSFTAVRGCDRSFATCKSIFGNATNFRGEPPELLPGVDRLVGG